MLISEIPNPYPKNLDERKKLNTKTRGKES
jgi:hypothetical protein